MAKLLSDLTKEELESICREQSCDIYILVETKKKVLEKNAILAQTTKDLSVGLMDATDQIMRLQAENARLIMLCRKHGIDIN